MPTTVVSPTHRPTDSTSVAGHVLILDDGGTLALTADLLLGREPDTHAAVVSGTSRGLLIVDETNAVSRHHLAITTGADGVHVTDLGSSNGTMVVNGATGTSAPLVPERATRLSIGDRVHLGARSFQLGYRHG